MDAQPQRTALQRLLNWKILLPFWLVFALLITIPEQVGVPARVQPDYFFNNLMANGVCCLIWAALTPLILRLAARFPLMGAGWPRRVILHIALSVFSTLIVLGIYSLVADQIFTSERPPTSFGDSMTILVRQFFNSKVLYYWALLLAHHAMSLRDQNNERRLRGAELERELTGARLEALRARIQPHFLFNTLNTVSSLVRLDRPEAALDTLEEFGGLLRRSLDHSENQFVSLREELDFIRLYLGIEERRFADRLRVCYRIDADVERAAIPALLLQPLVENAVRHGIGATRDGGEIEIVARSEGGELCIEILDDGPGPSKAAVEASGVGLANTRARLEQLFSGRHRIALEERHPRGSALRLRIPLVEIS